MRGTYRGYEILSMPPPSSGGIVLVEMLNILEGYRLDAPTDPKPAHPDRGDEARLCRPRAAISAIPTRWRFRSEPDLEGLCRAAARRHRRTRDGRHRSLQAPREGANTTHFSVIDRDGNAVANTYTLNFSYGLGLVAEGTGVLLNNELDDFTAKPGAANAFGLVGYDANLPAPGKRPLSSMSPTIVLKDGKPVLMTGSPGGSRIISAVLQVIVNSIDFNMPIDRAVSAPRLHHQWLPDEVDVEPGFAPDAAHGAAGARPHDQSARGHRPRPIRSR